MTIAGQKNLLNTFSLAILVTLTSHLHAQDWKTDRNINVVFGLTQPLLVKGFNIEGNYIHHRLIFDYSHGISLDFSGNAVTADLKRQGVVVHMPYTTGFGAGYRFTEWLNLRVEPKWHRFEVYYDGEAQNSANEITAFNTFSLGLGLYGNIRPFKHKSSFLNGFMLAPSIRFWPTVSSTLKGAYAYNNRKTLATEEIRTLDPGIGFTPIVFNVSIGYSFNLKKKN
jgi:hypothetical protein